MFPLYADFTNKRVAYFQRFDFLAVLHVLRIQNTALCLQRGGNDEGVVKTILPPFSNIQRPVIQFNAGENRA